MELKPLTIPEILRRKDRRMKLTMLTAYDYTTATILDGAGVDLLLVGDSLGMVVLGYDTTLPVTMEEMLHHTRAVRRGTRRALLVADMPFGSYQAGVADTLRNGIRFLKEAGADAVKLEGARPELVAALVGAEVPVMGHLGLTPQSVRRFGGYKVQARSPEAARRLVEDAEALAAAGAFCLVLEGIPREVAAEVTDRLRIPTIGIGAGPHCDGQVLVLQDMLGMYPDLKPKFVRRYLEGHGVVTEAVQRFIADVQGGSFPAPGESYAAAPAAPPLRAVAPDGESEG